MRRLFKILKIILLILTFLVLGFFAWFYFIIQIPEPVIEESLIKQKDLISYNDTTFSYQDAWLRKNSHGLWEMYISGNPEELGIKNGILSQNLIRIQEEAFVQQIKKMIPSESYLGFLKYVASFINHQLPEHIPNEYLKEIKAVSLFASNDFDFIGTNYERLLNYHAAHDIGHAMQNLHLVECTAFGVKGPRSQDSSLLIGRNFDFYVGDDFAKNKIIMFVEPEKGIPFASVTWGGMIGVVSGINKNGLSITLNSAKSEIPLFAKTPVSIIAREILQYASTIEEAYEIAKKHKSFVAESFMISSAIDQDMAVIEKTPDTTVLYTNKRDYLILTNHFQSDILLNSKTNQENLNENVTGYRHERVGELLKDKYDLDLQDMAFILRDTKGLGNKDIGLGNEGAINQLIAHHSIIFKPEERQLWISTSPYQIGEYIAYQLDTVFRKSKELGIGDYRVQNYISADTIFLSSQWIEYSTFKSLIEDFQNTASLEVKLLEKSNPNYFFTYEIIGDYYKCISNDKLAKSYYVKSLKCFVPNLHERVRIQNKIKDLEP